ncbi:putative RNA helicase SDE3 [Camellia lanceoleosa]|uniref:RNA helicase SDE3 n=1 Tax=Camellia lanceoleosa TaxID=1840588 RepID=A0ACC0IF94_9ERIC|nr:putative RNA helicase SDE3 [Camellia lanceoleosa]
MGIRELVENKQVPEVITQGLMKENYATYFNTLLNMEKLYLEKEMRCHDMERITMSRKGANLLALVVLGVVERRPSLVHGDFAFAMLASQSENDTYPP